MNAPPKSDTVDGQRPEKRYVATAVEAHVLLGQVV